MNGWLENNDTELYSTHNEGKSIVAERFSGTLKNRIYKYMTSILINQITPWRNQNKAYWCKIKHKL